MHRTAPLQHRPSVFVDLGGSAAWDMTIHTAQTAKNTNNANLAWECL